MFFVFVYSYLQKLDDARFGIQPVDDDDGNYILATCLFPLNPLL